MLVKISTSTLRRTKWHQYAVRFLFGGAIAAIAGVIAKHYGPTVGGLFLAFPAIFPAAATLAQSHEEEKKHEHQLHGRQRGILVAGAEAHGAAIGSIGLSAFAALFWLAVPSMNLALLFPLAIVTWFVISASIWYVNKRIDLLRHRPSNASHIGLHAPNPDSPRPSVFRE
jgi:hypothetical protein